MHKDSVLRADGNNLMRLNSSARVQQKEGEAFAFRVEIRIGGDVHPPLVGGFVEKVVYRSSTKMPQTIAFPMRKAHTEHYQTSGPVPIMAQRQTLHCP